MSDRFGITEYYSRSGSLEIVPTNEAEAGDACPPNQLLVNTEEAPELP